MFNIILLVRRCIPTLYFVLILLISNISFANLHRVANAQYQYTDEDIRNVINNRIGGDPYIYSAPAIPIQSPADLVDDVANNCINNFNQGKIALIPVNYNDAHWTAAVLRTDASGAASLYFNDPTGAQYRDTPLLNRIMGLMNIQLHDLKVQQQNDGTSCGAFTAEDLIALARVNSAELTLESAQILLSNITDATMLRNMHAGIVTPAASQEVKVTRVQKEIVREEFVRAMQNPEKHIVGLAEGSVYNNKAESTEIAKVANDDAAIANTTRQEQFLLFIANLVQATPNKTQEIIKHLANQGTRSVSTTNVIHETVSININNHLSSSNMVAVAAGNEDSTTKKAVWVTGTFGSSNQGEYKGNPSYSGTVVGGTIGADLYIGENSLVGIAYSRMNSDFKFKDPSTGDKLSAKSDIISLYGQQQFGSGFLLQEIFSASNSKIHNKDIRLAGKTAQGKYTSTAYALEANIGYQFAPLDSIYLIPNIGIKYNNYKDKAYTETGAGVNNMYVAGKSGNLVTSIAGIKLVAPQQLSNDTQIIPGLHASVGNSFNNKQPNVKARFIWADSYFENNSSTKMSKIDYNVGSSVLTKHKNIALLATYNCNLRSKYTNHQGSLKLKLLF